MTIALICLATFLLGTLSIIMLIASQETWRRGREERDANAVVDPY